MARGRVLVIDNGALRDALVHVLPDLEYVEHAVAEGTPDAVLRASSGVFDVLVADLSGAWVWERRTVARVMEACPDLPLVVALNPAEMGVGEIDWAESELLPERVFECLRVPVEPDALRRAVLNAVEKNRLFVENRVLIQRLNAPGHNGRNGKCREKNPAQAGEVAALLVGESRGIKQIRRLVEEVAPTDMTVLIAGESGTGKEVVARAIHSMSGRSQKGSLIKINCPAVPELLLESELFGHEAGAFTGAVERKPGRLELAVGGTAFLDEIGEIPLAVQAKLLQVLEHKQFTRLGGTETLSVDVRFLAATNMPLLEQINAKKFRTDLYFRLNQYVIHIPPLRDRVEDIPLLVEHFLSKYAPMYGREKLSVSEKTMGRLIRYSWPGNVRELESVLQCYALTGREESILEKLDGHGGDMSPQLGTYRQSEKKLILSTLVEVKWNRRRAAEILGISYNTLRRRIAAYCLDEQEPDLFFGTHRLRIGAGDLP